MTTFWRKVLGIVLIIVAIVLIIVAFLSVFGVMASWLVMTIGFIVTFALAIVVGFSGWSVWQGKDPRLAGREAWGKATMFGASDDASKK